LREENGRKGEKEKERETGEEQRQTEVREEYILGQAS